MVDTTVWVFAELHLRHLLLLTKDKVWETNGDEHTIDSGEA